MIYDCVTFFNELDLLEIRISILKDVVDKFVIVEAGETHTGRQKPFHFEANRGRFAAFEDRIVYRKIDRFPAGHGAWWNENYQRNEIAGVLSDIGAKDDDWAMVSDLDEIPDPEAIRRCVQRKGVYQFRLRSFGFYLNMLDYRTPRTHGTKLLLVGWLKTGFDGVETYYNEFLPEDLNQGTTVTKIRRRDFPSAKGGERRVAAGWHFTCLGGAKAVLVKMRAVAPHLGFDPESKELTEERVSFLLAQGHSPGLKMDCFAIPIDERLPMYVRRAKDKYKHLIFDLTPEYRKNVRFRRIVRFVQGRLIAICQWLCPAKLHNWLHTVKIKLLG